MTKRTHPVEPPQPDDSIADLGKSLEGLPWRRYLGGMLIAYIGLVVGTRIVFSLDLPDTLAFGQLLMDMLLLPTVLIGFAITIREYRTTLAIPKLDIHIQAVGAAEVRVQQEHDCRAEYEIRLVPIAKTYQAINLILVNHGNTVAVWYSVSLELPRDMLREIGGGTIDPRQIVQNNTEHWRTDTGSAVEHPIRLTFTSRGIYVSYPELEEILGTIRLQRTTIDSRTYWRCIPYTISTEQGTTRGIFKLTVLGKEEPNV